MKKFIKEMFRLLEIISENENDKNFLSTCLANIIIVTQDFADSKGIDLSKAVLKLSKELRNDN
jgi:hypothetical protein